MFSKMMDAVFVVRHSRYSFPLTIRAGTHRSSTVGRIGTYVVVLHRGP